MSPAALLFDLDGTLVDSERAIVTFHDTHPEADPPPLPGVEAGLLALSTSGRPFSVATTKPSGRAARQVEAVGLGRFFAHVQGTDPGMRPKPALKSWIAGVL